MVLRHISENFVGKVYAALDTKKAKSVDQLCGELGTDDDLAVIASLYHLRDEGKAAKTESRKVYDPKLGECLIGVYVKKEDTPAS